MSHSSKNKDFVRQLADDLIRLGHEPWLDEWEIRVGDSIVSKVQEGLAGTTHLVLVLTPDAVASGWVEREWQEAYWREINERKIVVLPVLLEKCDIPPLLGGKKYANFESDYDRGLQELAHALGGPSPREARARIQRDQDLTQVTSLIQKIQDRTVLLSTVVPEVLSVAERHLDTELSEFCMSELAGYEPTALTVDDTRYAAHRAYTVYASPNQLNPTYFGWGGSASNLLNYCAQHPEQFATKKLVDGRPLVQIEAAAVENASAATSYLYWVQRLKDFNTNTDKPNAPVFCYARADVYRDMLTIIRAELTTRLVRLRRSIL